MIPAELYELSEKTGIDLVRHYFAAYVSKDRKALGDLLADDFTFTSPIDDHINRTRYFARCWPNSEKTEAFHLEQVMAEGDEVLVLYRCEQIDGTTFRNTERFKIEAGKIKSVEVYFGRKLPIGANLVRRDAEEVASR